MIGLIDRLRTVSHNLLASLFVQFCPVVKFREFLLTVGLLKVCGCRSFPPHPPVEYLFLRTMFGLALLARDRVRCGVAACTEDVRGFIGGFFWVFLGHQMNPPTKTAAFFAVPLGSCFLSGSHLGKKGREEWIQHKSRHVLNLAILSHYRIWTRHDQLMLHF